MHQVKRRDWETEKPERKAELNNEVERVRDGHRFSGTVGRYPDSPTLEEANGAPIVDVERGKEGE